MRQSFKYRLYPNKRQQPLIDETLEHCRLRYNRLLAEHQEAYEKSGKTLSYVAPANSFPARKAAIPMLQSVHSPMLQDVAKRLDKAFHAFFRRVKNGEKPGYPRFKSIGRYHSFTDPQGGYAIEQGRVHLSKIGDVKMKLHRTQGLRKNPHLAKSIADAGWHQLVQVTTDKAERAGRRVVLAEPRFTSQDCSTPHCTYRQTDLTLADRTGQCPNCGVWHDRDRNAAQNILQRALVG